MGEIIDHSRVRMGCSRAIGLRRLRRQIRESGTGRKRRTESETVVAINCFATAEMS